MSFSKEIKTKALVACGRKCCICHKPCGTNMEVHHIKAVADGGEDTFENAIPLCFDCHANVRHYDSKHPKGTKFSEKELIEHRDNWYKKVSEESGISNDESVLKPIIIFKTENSEPKSLLRITSGKELISYAEFASGMEYDYDEQSSEEEVDTICRFMEQVQHILDGSSFMDASSKIYMGYQLSYEIKLLENSDFWVFAGKANRRVKGGMLPEDNFGVLIINILKKDNIKIQKVDVDKEVKV